MISALFIFNRKGDVLISKLFRDGLRRNISDVFRIQVIGNGEIRLPVLTLGSTTFLHIKSDGLWFVAVTRSNQDALIVFEYLFKLKELLSQSFGTGRKGELTSPNEAPKSVNSYFTAIAGSSSSSATAGIDEDAILNNFILIYEIIDQTLEFGYPQNMSAGSFNANLFSGTINTGSRGTSKVSTPVLSSIIRSPDISRSSTGGFGSASEISWRPTGIKYRKNQVFLDIHEEVNVLMNANGSILKSYVTGNIQMKSKLSGMPVCKFGLNDSVVVSEAHSRLFVRDQERKGSKSLPQAAAGSVVLEDVKFHQSVELSKFDSDRLIRFVPPDGQFELMRYRSVENINLPFIVLPKIREEGKTRIHIAVTVSSLFAGKLASTNVVIKIPVPPGSIKATLESTGGKARFLADECVVLWKFNKFLGQNLFVLQGSVDIVPGSATTTASAAATDKIMSPNPNSDLLKSPVTSQNIVGWSRPPIMVTFNLEMFSCSGLVVQYLKVEEPMDYSTVKWVKYLSKAGTYEIRY